MATEPKLGTADVQDPEHSVTNWGFSCSLRRSTRRIGHFTMSVRIGTGSSTEFCNSFHAVKKIFNIKGTRVCSLEFPKYQVVWR